MVKLYLHESSRVYRDKMVDDKDLIVFDKMQAEAVKKFYDVSVQSLTKNKMTHMCVAKKQTLLTL